MCPQSGKDVSIGYGLTETGASTVAVNGGPVGFQLHTVGKVLPYIKVKVCWTTQKLATDNESDILQLTNQPNHTRSRYFRVSDVFTLYRLTVSCSFPCGCTVTDIHKH